MDDLASFDYRPTFDVPDMVSKTLRARYAPENSVTGALGRTVFDTGVLWEKLDMLEEHIQSDPTTQTLIVGSAAAGSTALSVGYVLWTIRGGYLAASLMSSLPAWQMVDPLPILDSLEDRTKLNKRQDEEEDKSLAALVAHA